MFDYVEFPALPIVKAHLAINCVIALLATGTVVLRLMARFTTGAGLWWDDYLVLLGLPQAIGMLIIQGLWLPMGVGYDMPETLPNLQLILKLLVAYELIYATSIGTVKLSVMFFYLRVFVNRGLRLATKIFLGFVVAWSFANVLQVFLICRPFAKTYTPELEGVCGNQIASFIAIGVFNIVTDIFIIVMPLPTVWSLKMSTPTKLGLTAVFVVGLLVSIIAVIRIVTLTQLDMENLTGTMVWADFWSATEPLLAVLCISLPMLGSLVSRCVGRRSSAIYFAGGSASPNGSDNTAAIITIGGSHKDGSVVGMSKVRSIDGIHGDEDGFGDSDTHIPLESLYAANHRVHYESVVETGAPAAALEDMTPSTKTTASAAGHNRHGSKQAYQPAAEHEDSHSGSDVGLTSAAQRGERGLEGGGIRVQTKWSITRS
ncbi:hypothetical protein VTJ83DRAFT_3060 [Remersonia thermophila]|uniref:Rhodopsin domain-containing protein n=1 Tax=Remersonia thermophila TaxID=72144 RepID=A0ABR4DF73_9PEZI